MTQISPHLSILFPPSPSRQRKKKSVSKFRFNSKPTPEWLAAVGALSKLSTSEVGDAFAEVNELRLKDLYIKKRHGVKKSGGSACCFRLIGKQCGGSNRAIADHSRGLHAPQHCIDHASFWLKDGKAFSFVSQPYGVCWEGLCSLVDFCRKHGMEADITAGSWHFPGSTVLIEITRAPPRGANDLEVFIPDPKETR